MIDSSLVMEWSASAIRTALVLGGPVLLAALVVGVVVGIGQTLTQLHDPVVGMVPRIIVVLLVLLAVLPWMMGVWVGYARELIGTLPERLLG